MASSSCFTATVPAASARRRVSVRRRSWTTIRAAGVSALLLSAIGAQASAQGSTDSLPPGQAVYVTSHVDVSPAHVDDTIRALRDYVAAARQESGIVRIDAVQEARPNHFDVIEVWHDPVAYQAHQVNAATIGFHDQIFPWRGSPFEERLGHQIAP
jgi:quinol monooxygenase YgiN